MIYQMSQKLWNNQSLLTKGPIALFFGGPEILPYLSMDPFKYSNILLFIICTLTIGMKLSLELCKRLVFRNGLAYGQELRQTMINSLRNVYGPVSLILWFFGISGAFLLHYQLGKKKDSTNFEQQSRAGPLAIGAVFQTVLCIPFIINPGLR